MTFSANSVHVFLSNFVTALVVTSSKGWVSTSYRCTMGVFEQDVLLIPHETNDRKSLFVVFSATYVRSYGE